MSGRQSAIRGADGRPGPRPSTRPLGARSDGSTVVVLAGVFVVLATSAFVLGLVSLLTVRDRFVPPLSFLDLARGMIGLYTNETPRWESPRVAMPLGYEIAKVLGPLSTGYALVSTAAVLLTNQVRLFRARVARHHAIVCGGGSTGVGLARALTRTGLVVLVDAEAGSASTTASLVRRAVPVSGDPRDGLVLRRAGVRRAREVFALADADDVNASITLAALAAVIDRPAPLRCYALVEDRELHLMLQAHTLTSGTRATLGLHLLDRHQLYASAVVGREPPEPTATTVLVGAGETARALAMEIARHLVDHPRGGRRARLLLVGSDANATAELITARLVAPTDGLDVVVHTADLAEAPAAAANDGTPARVFVSEADGDRATLRSGLAWLGHVADLDRVVLCMDGESGLTSAFSQHANDLFARSADILRVYSPVIALSDPDHIRDQTFQERIARRLHLIFLREVAAADGSAEPGSELSRMPWSELADTYKSSNRDQAAEIGRKLTGLGLTVVPVGTRPTRVGLSTAQVELLAEMEHERWMAERLRSGYTLGPARTANQHPDLVPWQDLNEAAKEKDRVFVRRIPELLLAEGLEPVRNPAVAPAAPASP